MGCMQSFKATLGAVAHLSYAASRCIFFDFGSLDLDAAVDGASDPSAFCIVLPLTKEETKWSKNYKYHITCLKQFV